LDRLSNAQAIQNVKRAPTVRGLRNLSKKLDWHDEGRLELCAV